MTATTRTRERRAAQAPCRAGCAGGDRIFRCEWVIFVRGRVSVSKAGGGCVFLLLRSRKWELMLFLIIAASSRLHCCACSRRPGLSKMCRRVPRSSQAPKGAQRGGEAACGNGPISPIFTAQVLHTRADARTLSASTSPAHEHAGMGKKYAGNASCRQPQRHRLPFILNDGHFFKNSAYSGSTSPSFGFWYSCRWQ